jgi:hypothetical protein
LLHAEREVPHKLGFAVRDGFEANENVTAISIIPESPNATVTPTTTLAVQPFALVVSSGRPPIPQQFILAIDDHNYKDLSKI